MVCQCGKHGWEGILLPSRLKPRTKMELDSSEYTSIMKMGDFCATERKKRQPIDEHYETQPFVDSTE